MEGGQPRVVLMCTEGDQISLLIDQLACDRAHCDHRQGRARARNASIYQGMCGHV